MKQVLFCLLASAQLFAYSYWDFHPWHAGGNAIGIGSANTSHQRPMPAPHGTVVFDKANVYSTILIPFNAKNYIFPRIEFNYVHFNWDRNPKFTQTHFTYLQFGLMFYSIALEKWKWIARVDYNIQADHMSRPGQYGLCNWLLWGANQLHRKWHYHIGTLGYAGLESFYIYPVIGFDFAPNKKWLFEAIFPMIYSINYFFLPRWTLSLKGRPLKERLRAGRHEPDPRSIFSYSSIGAELNLRYEIERRLTVEAFGGYNFGGGCYVKNKRGHQAIYADISGAPYGGFTLDWGF